MARKKQQPVTTLDSWNDVDETLAEIAKCQRDLDRSNAMLADQVARAKARAKKFAAEPTARKRALEQDVYAFLELHRAEFAQVRSRKLTHGVVGFQKTSALATLAKWTWAKVRDWLAENGREDLLRRKDPDVNKQEITRAFRAGELTEPELRELGCRFVTTDDPYYEPPKEAVGAEAADLAKKAG